jgi:hypothetical protein
MAHGLGRKSQMSIPSVMRKFRKGHSFGTEQMTLRRPSEFKATRHRLRMISNPSTSEESTIQREDLESLEGKWTGSEHSKGQGDRRAMVYQRAQGRCGVCGNFVPWEEAELDHSVP